MSIFKKKKELPKPDVKKSEPPKKTAATPAYNKPKKKAGPTPQQQEKMRLEKEIRALKEEKDQLLADGGLSEENWQKLLDYCFFLVREKGVTFLEMRGIDEQCLEYADQLRQEQEVAAFTEERIEGAA